MRTLIEVSRAAGVPMPVIVRLQREHPDQLPAVGVGAALFFPEGVIPEIKALAEGEQRGARQRSSPEPRLGSPPRGPTETRRASGPSAPPASASASSKPPLGVDYALLARRIERLDLSLQTLSRELGEVAARLERSASGSTPSL